MKSTVTSLLGLVCLAFLVAGASAAATVVGNSSAPSISTYFGSTGTLINNAGGTAMMLSLTINLVGLVAIGNVIRGRGGIAYLRAIASHDTSANPDPSYMFRTGMFDISTVKANSRPILFLGDSLTCEGNWQEFFGVDVPILNRGIGGDTSVGVLRRIGQITALNPLAVFLMIGTNDAQTIGFSPADTARIYREIVAAIRRDSPDTLIYIQALLPSKSPKFVAWSEETNRLIAQLADNRSAFFLDVRKPFLENGLMSGRLTRDGLHLSAEGYRVWKRLLDPVMTELLRKSPVTRPQRAPALLQQASGGRRSSYLMRQSRLNGETRTTPTPKLTSTKVPHMLERGTGRQILTKKIFWKENVMGLEFGGDLDIVQTTPSTGVEAQEALGS